MSIFSLYLNKKILLFTNRYIQQNRHSPYSKNTRFLNGNAGIAKQFGEWRGELSFERSELSSRVMGSLDVAHDDVLFLTYLVNGYRVYLVAEFV